MSRRSLDEKVSRVPSLHFGDVTSVLSAGTTCHWRGRQLHCVGSACCLWEYERKHKQQFEVCLRFLLRFWSDSCARSWFQLNKHSTCRPASDGCRGAPSITISAASGVILRRRAAFRDVTTADSACGWLCRDRQNVGSGGGGQTRKPSQAVPARPSRKSRLQTG
jgi:hypothetical protein